MGFGITIVWVFVTAKASIAQLHYARSGLVKIITCP
jgi:hypothetical protein